MAVTNSQLILPNNHEPNTPLTLITINNSIKLTPTNYISWKLQIESILIGYDLFKYVDGSFPPPPDTLPETENNTTTSNPAYHTWVRQDKLLFGALVGTLSPSLVPLLTHSRTSQTAWDILAQTFARPTRGHIKQIKDHLKHISKGSQSVSDYMQQIKAKSDELALLGKPMDEEDLIEKVLEGLDDSYQPVIDGVNSRDSAISFTELHEKLINRELFLQTTVASHSFPASAHFSHSQKSGTRNNSRSFSSSRSPWQNRQPASSPPPSGQPPPRPFLGKCQWCRRPGHVVTQCFLFRQQFPTASPPAISGAAAAPAALPPWQAQAHATTASAPWLLDSGASHHITADPLILDTPRPYSGPDEIMIGDGTTVPISHTGSTSLSTSSHSFLLSNVLCSPLMTKNLLSIYQFCTSNSVSIEFSPSGFSVKDLLRGTVLHQGSHRNGVYEWHPASASAPPSASVSPSASSAPLIAFSSARTSSSVWHHRLGHPASPILHHIFNSFGLDVSPSPPSHCNSCLQSKSSKLPFKLSSLISSSPLEIIFTDLWTSPVYSITGFKYYVIFVDHFTKFTWLYPLTRKSDTASVFIKFTSLVENFFSRRIKTLYSDNGGEFMTLQSFLAERGISHLTTPPHTPEHNGYSERRHRHIVDTGLSLLTHASLPLSFWPFAFSTAVFLINRLPTATLHLASPYLRLFGHPPSYTRLRSFGCLCYPWLRPYTNHKLHSRSLPCIFVGYSPTQHAYLCFHSPTARIFVSRHVRFVETVFPSFPSTPSSPSPPSASDWCSVSLPLLPASPPPVSLPPSPSPSPPSPSPPPSAPPPPPVRPSTSTIVTRSQNQIYKPIQRLNLHASLASSPSLPSSLSQALADPLWHRAMTEEFQALTHNNTWVLVPPSPSQNVVGCRWIFRLKFHSDGTLARHKARLVAKGFHQRPGLDFSDTFSPVVKPTTVRLVLSLAVTRGWPLRQLDVNNAFLQGSLRDTVYMSQPPGFVDSRLPHHVCCLHRAIYGLRQAPRAWYSELRRFLLDFGFTNSVSDASLFICLHGTTTLYLLVYVDDLILTGHPLSALQAFVLRLSTRFSLKDMGALNYFLGVEVHRHPAGLFLSQRKYVADLLRRTLLSAAKPVATPMASSSALTLLSGSLLPDPTEYRATVGSLQYLSLTRPDISFTVNKLAQFLHQPTQLHWTAVKRLLRYLNGTMDYGINLYSHSSLQLHAFSDSDWAGDRLDFTSTGAYLVYLGSNIISWSSKKQRTVARSSTEAEYRSVASTAAELRWLCSILTELGVSVPSIPTIFCDNLGATSLCANPVFHSRMKHVALDYHFIREQVQSGTLLVTSIPAHDQLADILTKPLPFCTFHQILSKIGLTPPTSILREHNIKHTESANSEASAQNQKQQHQQI